MTGTELLDLVSTNLMALFGFAASNSIALLSLLVAVFVWRQSRADAKLAKETAEFTRRTTEEAAQFAKETAVMSVKPHLSLNTNRSPPKGIYEASIQNNGIGPALIKSFTVYIDGQEATATGHVRPFENAVLQLEFAINRYYTSTPVEGAGLSAGAVEKIFSIELHRDNLPLTAAVLTQIQRLALRIEYTDLYGNVMPTYDSRDNGEWF
ncbi:hypothetical protein [Marinomonas primoryensis]|uniref:Uncharacterized protein n=1 Tax=Marinomonas primoryensis TaxID=178399 RepID=A0ABV0L4Z6_9GAMM